ncbi:hypothetical protein [Acidicapsa acidisoli]|uniref:hypothetical protein n=1 Tax=Acidicapsa acidisoli TaxID=1615681 RepID=UPI0021E07ADE|nr:hypothetical protein [Acidicapsa acidisoli]
MLFNKKSVSAVLYLGLILAGGAGVAKAQVIDTVQATIPFQFQAGLAVFPAGTYTIRSVDTLVPSEMEIRSIDGRKSALFIVESDQAKQAPENSELIFEKVGDRFSLENIFDGGSAYGDEVVGYKHEKHLTMEAAAQQVTVPATHAGM